MTLRYTRVKEKVFRYRTAESDKKRREEDM